MVAVYILLQILFYQSDPILCIFGAMYVAGLWGIFRKFGLPGWKALIPVYREYVLARCVDYEKEGVILCAIRTVEILSSIGTIVLSMSPDSVSNAPYIMAAFLTVLAWLMSYLLISRVYFGLIENFGKRKWWIVLWLLIPGVPALLWGFMKVYQPSWMPEDFQKTADTYFSNANCDVLENGLTVNLKERVATEMFRKKYLLRDVHMAIQPGHMVLLLGGSGAGKTTLLNAVIGYEKANAEIKLNGTDLYANYKKMQYEIGFVPQLDLMRGSDTVFSTLKDAAMLRLPASFNKAERLARVEEVMGIFGLKPVKNNMVSKLSGGQRKRLSIAMEFISNPTLFILDEPDSGLDGVMARELMQQLRNIANQGKIVIVITHTPDRVIDLFDDVIVLAKDAARTGRLAYFGSIKEAKTFFGKDSMEKIVMSINRQEEGGEGRADEFINKFVEVQNG